MTAAAEPAWTAAEQAIADTLAAQPTEADYRQARAIVKGLQRAGFSIVAASR